MHHLECVMLQTEETYGDQHRREPYITFQSQHLGCRLIHRVFPHHWARVLIARNTAQQFAND